MKYLGLREMWVKPLAQRPFRPTPANSPAKTVSTTNQKKPQELTILVVYIVILIWLDSVIEIVAYLDGRTISSVTENRFCLYRMKSGKENRKLLFVGSWFVSFCILWRFSK